LQLDVEQDQRDQTVHWTPKPGNYDKLNAAIDKERAKCASVLNSPPPAGADGLARALHATAQAAASGPSLRDDLPPSLRPAGQDECAAEQAPPAWPRFPQVRPPSKL